MSGSNGDSAVVVGAGIAGLAVAYGLTHLGYSVRVMERQPGLRTEGAGITLWPNAVSALRALGLGDVVEQQTHVVRQAVTLTPAGRLLTELPLDRMETSFGPLVSAHRGDLLQGLLEHVDVPVEFGTEVRTLDGALHAGSEQLDAELIVGADGMRSAVREAVALNISPRAAGYGAWRGVAQTGEATTDRAWEAIGRGKRFGVVPLKEGRTYWFAVLSDSDRDDQLESAFEGWHESIATVLAATPDADRSYLPLNELPKLPRWHRNRIVLVGDAAHAMTPILGQGAAQALLDVAVLCEEISQRSLTEAAGTYESRRKRKAERVVRQSRTAGRIAHASNPLAVGVRDLLARHLPVAVAARQMARTLS